MIDLEDLSNVSARRWQRHTDSDGKTYAIWKTRHLGRQIEIPMHRFILGLRPRDGTMVDHKNGNGLDNRRDNLRICTNSQNQANSTLRKTSNSGFKGVSRSGNSWRAQLGFNGRVLHLGMYQNKIDAAIAYDLAAIRFFGSFARTNVIENE